MVTSAPRDGEGPAGEGVYLMTALGVLRLPMNERIRVWVDENEDLHAEHELHVLGMRAFRLRYAIAALAPREAPDD